MPSNISFIYIFPTIFWLSNGCVMIFAFLVMANFFSHHISSIFGGFLSSSNTCHTTDNFLHLKRWFCIFTVLLMFHFLLLIFSTESWEMCIIWKNPALLTFLLWSLKSSASFEKFLPYRDFYYWVLRVVHHL